MNIQDTILEQNPQWQGKISGQEYIRRELLDKIKLQSSFIEVIAGVRRSGKSTIFRIIVDNLIKTGKAKPEEILLLNFDHPSFISYYQKAERLDEIVEQAEILSQKKIRYLFFDEVQNINLWEKWAKAKYDTKAFLKMFVTGSNANLLEGDYISRLSGRYYANTNFPFSFREFLEAKGQPYYFDYAKNYPLKHRLVGFFEEYLRFGGFPEFIKDGDPDILTNYYQTILLKDVVAGNEVRDVYGLQQTAYYLISNIANLFSYNRLGRQAGLHEGTVKEYVDYLKQAYLFDDLKKFDHSIQKQNRNPRKIYCVDSGLINRVGFNFSLNSGRFLENLVFWELKRRFEELYYHKENKECDFVAGEKTEEGVTVISEAFQVCYSLTSKNKEREFSGLLEAMEKHNLSSGTVLTNNQHEEMIMGKKKITLMPVWRWLIERQ